MAKHEVITTWAGGMAFDALVTGHTVRMDADAAADGKDSGPRPKALLLAALGGCTGMDVVSILAKMKEPLSWFDMKAEAEVRDEHPKYYTSITLVYRFKASDGLDHEKVKHAVDLSQEKYCGVSALFKLAIPVDYRIEYL